MISFHENARFEMASSFCGVLLFWEGFQSLLQGLPARAMRLTQTSSSAPAPQGRVRPVRRVRFVRPFVIPVLKDNYSWTILGASRSFVSSCREKTLAHFLFVHPAVVRCLPRARHTRSECHVGLCTLTQPQNLSCQPLRSSKSLLGGSLIHQESVKRYQVV